MDILRRFNHRCRGLRCAYHQNFLPAALLTWVLVPHAGLMIRLDASSSSSVKVLFPLAAGMGLGLLLHAPYQVFTRALQSRDMAIGTSAFFLVRFTGATIGLVSAIF